MSWLPQLRHRLRALFRRKQLEAEMAEELRTHLELQAAANRAAGMDPEEASFAAHRRFGGLDQIKETARDQRGWEWLGSWGKDFSYAARSLARSPGFTLVVVLTLAFGVAVNSSIFGLFGSLFLRKLPVPDAGRLALVVERVPGESMLGNNSLLDFKDYRARATSFSTLCAYNFEPAHLSAPGRSPERVLIQLVTPDAFAAFGVPAALGRTLLPSDGEDKGCRAVAVLTHRYWQNRFGGDPGILGRTILLNERPFEVVGVAAEGFDGFSLIVQMSAFVPSGAAAALYGNGVRQLEDRGFAPWYVLGKLRSGATIAGASAELQVIGRQLAVEYPDSHRHAGSTLLALPESRARPDPSIADFTVVFAALFLALVALVLLIACANVANLMLARAAARQPEFLLRAALGAGRWRLARLVVAESVLVAIVAGAAGWAASFWTGSLVMRYAFAFDAGFPLNTEYRPAARDLVFAAGISLAAALLSSLVPALRSSRVDLATGIKGAAAGRTPADPHRIRDLLVVGQVVFSLVVLVGAGLFLQSLRRVRALALGFRSDHLLMLRFDLGLQGYAEERGREFCRQLLERSRSLPGVDAASLAQHVPFEYSAWARDIWPENPPARLKDGRVLVYYNRSDPSLAATLGVRVIRGRPLRETDTASAPRVTVVNRALAELCWPGEDPIGKRVRWLAQDGPWLQVVGVVETGRYVMISEPPRPYMYLPIEQDYSAPLALMVRTRVDPQLLANDLRATVRSLDSHLPVYNVQTMDHLLDNSFLARMPMRLGATLSAFQGAIGLGLAVLGLYAVVAHGVSRRTREIGIRMALGANARDVVRAVVRDGMRLAVAGLAAGLILAAALGVVLSKFLYGIGTLDPGVIAAGTLLLLATTALACWLPARRAARVNPIDALRAE